MPDETKQAEAPLTIVVAGDITADWLRLPLAAPAGAKVNWQMGEGSRLCMMPGGALMLAQMVREACPGAEVLSQPQGKLDDPRNPALIRSFAQIEPVPLDNELARKEDKARVQRITRLLGFDGPPPEETAPYCPPVENDQAEAGLVILDDAGNGFRDNQAAWPLAIQPESGKQPRIIYKAYRPLARGPLWEHLIDHHADNLTTIVSADDLRRQGLKISRGLSWERTALDLAGQLQAHPLTRELCRSRHLIIRVGLEGAFLHSRLQGKQELFLFFHPSQLESDLDASLPGTIFGQANAFTAGLAQAFLAGLDEAAQLALGLRGGLNASRNLLKTGLTDGFDQPCRPGLQVKVDLKQRFPRVQVPLAAGGSKPDPGWTILEAMEPLGVESHAFTWVHLGRSAALEVVPLISFGKLQTADRSEIEGFRAIQNLMAEYLKKKDPARPLSVAVFGPPGAGKSFAVKQMAQTLGMDPAQDSLTFNVSQFTSSGDLTKAFFRIEDLVVAGKTPLIFFDEFDASLGSQPLGWLKYFLMPMQDGQFVEGETAHPLGKCILVFAGGTSHAYAGFIGRSASPQGKPSAAPGGFSLEFRQAKGPDFVSRLQGYVDILGPDPQGPGDRFWALRRAFLLRALLKQGAGHLFEANGHCRIQDQVISAFLRIPGFKHGARSITAIIDMSLLQDRQSFEAAALPAPRQLELHVDPEIFLSLLQEDAEWLAQVETLAPRVHDYYRDHVKSAEPAWENLDPDRRESNRAQLAFLTYQLRALGYGLKPLADGASAQELKLDKEQIELLARREHDRWNDERVTAGWRFGDPKDPIAKISPYLVPWDLLPEDIKEYDRKAVAKIPVYLKGAGFQVFKLTAPGSPADPAAAQAE